MKDVYFDYDKADIRGDQQASIQADAQFFAQHQNMNFTVEGHCDERGSTEYNLALGDQRASAVKNALTAAGVSASRIKTISYGKEKPFCTESNEACWQQNRRGHLRLSEVGSDSCGDAVGASPVASCECAEVCAGSSPLGMTPRFAVESSGSAQPLCVWNPPSLWDNQSI